MIKYNKRMERTMKKILILSMLFTTAAGAATTNFLKWWEQDTICRINPSQCYTSMGIGFNTEYWDADSNCWGGKVICGTALLDAENGANKTMSRNAITKYTGINKDFDTNVLNGDCYGARKTTSNGSLASYKENMVNVYCSGVLENIYDYNDIETVPSGSILTRTRQPQCAELAEYGYVNVLNGNCYGKQYNDSEYYIGCDNNEPYLIVLNGADGGDFASAGAPTTRAQADEIFKRMIENAETNRNKK